jgi:hypothetical protein
MPPVRTASPVVSAEGASRIIKRKDGKPCNNEDIRKSARIFRYNKTMDDKNTNDKHSVDKLLHDKHSDDEKSDDAYRKWIPDNVNEILKGLSKLQK